MESFKTTGLRIEDERLYVLDQRLLPDQEIWNEVRSPEEMAEQILTLAVRGAPLIGVAAALSLAHFAKQSGIDQFKDKANLLRRARPTAVNLMNAVDRMLISPENANRTAYEILREDIDLCNKMGNHGEKIIQNGETILTHCNTGGLATAGIGTALGVIRKAHEAGKNIHVIVDETRPLLQGGRLTTWELEKLSIPYTLICDNMAADLMRAGHIQRVLVGSDRIALNGDFANKVGTYSVAVVAKYHGIPFHPVAPYTTVDFECESGKDIPIEDRSASEVQGFSSPTKAFRWSPKNSQVKNPAFDVTPQNLVSSWILDQGVFDQRDVVGGALAKLKS